MREEEEERRRRRIEEGKERSDEVSVREEKGGKK